MTTIWMYDDPRSGFHDTACQCTGHCLNCWEDLAQVRASVARLIEAGHLGEESRVGLRARYCSAYCRGRAKRDRALDRRLSGRCLV